MGNSESPGARSGSAFDTDTSSVSEPVCRETPKALLDLLSELKSEIGTIESKTYQGRAEKFHLKTLKNIAYDAEDVIADFDAHVIDRKTMEDRGKRLSERRTAEKRTAKALTLSNADGKRRKTATAQQQTGSLPSYNKIYGRDQVMKEIIDFIDFVANEKREKRFILTVTGAAGIGKTALMQHVFAHDRVKSRFQMLGWVSARKNYDELTLTKAVYESLTKKSSSSSITTLADAQNKLRTELRGRQCFLVLDNVWNTRKEFWSGFWEPLAKDLAGSVVFVITRDLSVKKNMPQEMIDEHFILVPLDEKASRELFSSMAYVQGRHKEPEGKYREVINRCRGMPTLIKRAAVTDGRKWRDGVGRQGDVPDVTASYCCLEQPLKRCIAYCTLFPVDHNFSIDLLVRRWIAEGFIQPIPEKPEKELEEIGMEYFYELCYQSFFLYADNDLWRSYMLPNSEDLKECLRVDYSNTTSVYTRTSARHVSYLVDGQDMVKWKEMVEEESKLRTFILCPRIDPNKGELSHLKIDLSALPKLPYLRVLDLSYTDLDELPTSIIQHSKHLRFLGLNGTKIRKLPPCECAFHNLQTLELKYCFRLEELPQEIRCLKKLRHLDISKDTNLCMPTGFGDLTELQTLPIFNVGRAEGFAGIGELKNLTKLEGELCISGLCNVADSSDCEEAQLANKQGINKLTLAWPLPDMMIALEEEEFSDNDDGESTKRAPNAEWDEESNRRGSNLKAVDNATASTQDVRSITTNPISSEENSNTVHFALDPMDSNIQVSDVNSSSRDVPQEDNGIKKEIFEKLRPHDELEVLVVMSYDGTGFPEWIADKSFKVQKMHLEDCKKCNSLPALGLLPSLEELVMNRMTVESIGSEFCPCSGTDPSFPKLNMLIFNEFYKLHSWTDVKESDFPKLGTFIIFNCPKLRSIPCFVSLKALEIENCWAIRELPELTKLQTLKLIACDGLEKLPNFKELSDLTVSYCKELVSLPELPSIKKLWLEDCDNLKSVGFLGETPTERKDKIKSFSGLLVINCPQLGFSAQISTQNDVSKFFYKDSNVIVEETLSGN